MLQTSSSYKPRYSYLCIKSKMGIEKKFQVTEKNTPQEIYKDFQYLKGYVKDYLWWKDQRSYHIILMMLNVKHPKTLADRWFMNGCQRTNCRPAMVKTDKEEKSCIWLCVYLI